MTIPCSLVLSATTRYNFLSFFLSLVWALLPTHCRCRGLLLHLISFNDTHTHTRLDSSGREISPTQRPLPDNTQHSQETNIHAPAGIQMGNPSKRAAAGLRLRPRRHRDRLTPFDAVLLCATKVYVIHCLTGTTCVGIRTEIR
jgi:hypothetical protein